MEKQNFISLSLGGLTLLATLVSVIQGIQYITGSRVDFGPIVLVVSVVIMVSVFILRWGYFHLVRTGIINFSSSFTQDEKAWSQAKESLVYVGVTGFSIAERFLAWYEKNGNGKKVPGKIRFYLIDPNDEKSLGIIASHRAGREATLEEVAQLRNEVNASLGKLKGSQAAKNGRLEVKFYQATPDFIPIWLYAIDGKKIYLGFTPPGETGMNSPAYLCSKRAGRYGLFDAYYTFIERLGAVDGTPSPDLAAQVVQKLRAKNLFVTSVESCTGGGFANSLTNITGASEVMKGAFICYSNEQKLALGVPAEVIDRYTVYSVETAIAMAKVGMRAVARADIGVGITGSISCVDPANPNSQPGEVYVAVKFGDKIISRKFAFADRGERWEVKGKVINEAMKIVLEILKNS